MKRVGSILAVVFFILTCLAVAATFALFGGIATAVIALGLAEFLIRRHGFRNTGVEAALWLCGAFALVSALPRSGKPEAILVVAAAAGVAGWRVRNPYVGALAVAIALSYVGSEYKSVVIPVGLVVATVALAALSRRWERSTEALWIAILLVAPLVAAMWSAWSSARVWAAAYLGFAAIALAAGIRLRHHAPFFAALIAAAIGMTEARLPIEEEWQLIIAGALLVGIAGIVTRALRGKTTGFVVTPARLTRYDDLLETAGTVVAQPAHPAPAPQPGGGGEFGGAGATGKF
jgi:hypothetical protein